VMVDGRVRVADPALGPALDRLGLDPQPMVAYGAERRVAAGGE
jgi:hypothetical protein